MPISKKRKKGGRPVQMKPLTAPHGEEHHTAGSDPKAAPAARRVGKPSNPFVAQQSRRASQRGR
jgi:hypothetical protein